MLPDRSADNPALVSRDAGVDALAGALRLYVGRGRRYSVKQLSNATGVKDRVIECAMAGSTSGDCRPIGMGDLLSLASFLGAEFTSEWLGKAQLGAFALPEGDDTPPGDLAADNSDDNATLTRAAVDGTFDRTERPALREVGKRMMNRGAALAQLRVA